MSNLLKLGTKFRQIYNPRPVMTAAERAAKRQLSGFGAYVRTVARRSIRKPGKKGAGISDPGSPPKSHLGFLRNLIFWAYNHARQSVVIGPEKKPSKAGTAPSALEYGGSSIARIAGKRRYIRVRARPYMRPAFAIGRRDLIPQQFKNSVK